VQVRFVWEVGDYRLQEASTDGQVGVWLIPNTWGSRSTEPLRDHSALFRTFAATAETPVAILNFANQYGLLGGPAVKFFGVLAEEESSRAEPIERWLTEIQLMRTAIALWDSRDEPGALVREGHALEEIAERLHWLDEGQAGAWGSPAARLRQDAVIDRVRKNPYAVAMFTLQSVINTCLASHLKVSIEHGARDNFPLTLEPDSLRTALWLQFAQSVEDRIRYRQCAVCNKWFEISTGPKGSRKHRRYCSDACRMKAYRKRQDEA
jgi:hypothetical protein